MQITPETPAASPAVLAKQQAAQAAARAAVLAKRQTARAAAAEKRATTPTARSVPGLRPWLPWIAVGAGLLLLARR